MARFNIGDKVIWRPWTGKPRRGTIVDEGEKDGRLLYDVRLDDGPEIERDRWGYPDQFTLIN